MRWMNDTFGIGSVFRPVGLLLLIAMFVFQVAASPVSAAASMADRHAQHPDMADAAVNCPTHSAQSGAYAHGGTNVDGSHENFAHCMPSMCCFHDTVSTSNLVAVGMLLPGAQIIDRGKTSSSNAGSTQKRPPRHV